MLSALDWLIYGAQNFIPRAQCGRWTAEMMTTAIVAEVTIGVLFLVLWQSLHPVHDRYVKPLFATCGVGHLLDAAVFWWPNYPLFTAQRVMTALFAVVAVIAISRARWKDAHDGTQ